MKVYILPIGIRVIIPMVFGLIFYLIFEQSIYWQMALFVFAMFGLMIWLAKYNHLDRQNMKKNGSTKMDKRSEEYIVFRRSQRVILYSSLLNIAGSYLIFFIFGA